MDWKNPGWLLTYIHQDHSISGRGVYRSKTKVKCNRPWRPGLGLNQGLHSKKQTLRLACTRAQPQTCYTVHFNRSYGEHSKLYETPEVENINLEEKQVQLLVGQRFFPVSMLRLEATHLPIKRLPLTVFLRVKLTTNFHPVLRWR
jgi:hypothetical protein